MDEPLQVRASRPYWRAGWVSDEQGPAHRLDPRDPDRVMCGSLTELFGPTMEKRPAGAECGPCCVQIHKARRKAMREAQQQATGGRRRVKITDPEAVDRYDRARLRGSSVSTVSAGLPGLGKRS